MNAEIKIFSKTVMLNRTLKLAAILLVSLVLAAFSNNVFVAVKYLFEYLSTKESFSFLNGKFRAVSLAVLYFIGALFSVMLVSPLKFSRQILFYENAKKAKTKLSEVFFSYKPHWLIKSVRLRFSLLFAKFFWSLLYFFPSVSMAVYLFYSLRGGVSKTMLILVLSSITVSFLGGLYFSFVTFQRYALSYILFFENDGISPAEAIRSSAQLMDENCFRLAKLKMSFIPWFLLCLLVFPIFYVYPYYKLSVSYYLNKVLSAS